MFDAARDHRRWVRLRLFAWLGIVACLGVAWLRDSRSEWHRIQAQTPTALVNAIGKPSGVRELQPADAEPERCTTCHLGVTEEVDGEKAPYNAHRWDLSEHPPKVFGCTSCHGGTGRALTSKEAHAQPGTEAASARLMPPYIEASCTRCHLAGAVPETERVARGAYLYLELGCGLCHSLATAGRGGWDDGPDLRTTRQVTVAALTESILEPTADFPDSTMPSYKTTFANKPEALAELITYVLSLSLPAAPRAMRVPARMSPEMPCNSCHTTTVAKGSFHHDCIYLHDRRSELRCSGCHTDGAPKGRGLCPILLAHAPACAACHAPERGEQ